MSQITLLDPKDPDETVDYGINWRFRDEDDEIVASTWTVQAGLTKIADPITSVVDPFTSTTTTVWVTGGSAGTSYTARNRITTLKGRVRDRTIIISVRER